MKVPTVPGLNDISDNKKIEEFIKNVESTNNC